jgi:hypothetical protein
LEVKWPAAVPTLAVLILAFAMPAAAEEALEFSADATSDGARFALADMAAVSRNNALDFWFAEADFNGDARLDVLAFAMDSYFCGSGGCSPRLYVASKKGWKEITFYGLGRPANWSLLDATDHGYRRVVYREGDTDYLFGFTGEYYDDMD